VAVPNPDGLNTTAGFTYERLGIRVPTVRDQEIIIKQEGKQTKKRKS
jgi:hypothetical protein